MSGGHDDHGHDDHAAPVSTASATPTLGGTPKWIGWIIAVAVILLLLVLLFYWKPWKNFESKSGETKDSKKEQVLERKVESISIDPLGDKTINVPFGWNYNIESGDYNYEDNLTESDLDGNSENKRGQSVKWFKLQNRTSNVLKVKIIWTQKF